MVRRVTIWTWDCGRREIDLDADAATLVPVIETILEGGLWRQFRKFPPDVVARLLPHLGLAPQTRRLLEIWIEEARRRAA